MAPRPIDLAQSVAGHTEFEPVIREYLRNGGANLDPATTAWCAAFVNSTLAQSGMRGTGSNAAKSFLNYGESVAVPQPGDIAVFNRSGPNPDPNLGHVGFYMGTDPYGRIRVLGGNQGDAVNEMTIDPDRLAGYRRPAGSPEQGLPDTLASAVSPGVSSAISGLDLSQGRPQEPQRGRMRRSAVEDAGATMTPLLAKTMRINTGREEMPYPTVEPAIPNQLPGSALASLFQVPRVGGALQRLRRG